VAEPSSDMPVVMLPGVLLLSIRASPVCCPVYRAKFSSMHASSPCKQPQPPSPSAGGGFLFQPCSAGIDGGGTISSYARCSDAFKAVFMIQVPRLPASPTGGEFLFQAAAPAMASAAILLESCASTGVVGDCWITASTG
jgi:hypothetical protein